MSFNGGEEEGGEEEGHQEEGGEEEEVVSQNSGPGTSTGIDRQLLVGQSPYFMCREGCEDCRFAAGGVLRQAVFPQFVVPVYTRMGGPARTFGCVL